MSAGSYHLSVKAVSRSTGRSAVASAAYRSGERLTNERDGQTHDFTRRSGVDASFIVAPAGTEAWTSDRSTLWNTAERAENRKNSTVAREYELALPAELDAGSREQLARDFAEAVVMRFGVVADVAIHAPGRGGDQRNHHAHILTTTRRAGADGLGEKTRELDDQKSGAIEEVRSLWAGQVNQALERAGRGERVDHRSHARQDAERGQDARDRLSPPGVHLGPGATAIERRAVRERVRDLPENAKLMERHRAGRFQGDSRRGVMAQERKADHLAIITARHAVREAESDHRTLVTAAELDQARQAKAQAAERDSLREKVQAAQAARQRPAQAPPPPAAAIRLETAVSPQQADLRRWRAMSEAELRQEVAKILPSSPATIAEQRPEVAAERTAQNVAGTAAQSARTESFAACNAIEAKHREIREIRESQGFGAKFAVWCHDKGLYRQSALVAVDAEMATLERQRAKAQKAETGHLAEATAAQSRANAAVKVALPTIEAQLRPQQERHQSANEVLNEKARERWAKEKQQERQKGRNDRSDDGGR